MNILNLGSGDNPMTSAINVDLRVIKGVNVVASAEQLPFPPLYFQKIFSHNPFDYNPVSKKVADALERGYINCDWTTEKSLF